VDDTARPVWERRYIAGVFLTDYSAAAAALVLTSLLREFHEKRVAQAEQFATGMGLVVLWVVAVAVLGGYRPRTIGIGAREYGALGGALALSVAVAATGAFFFRRSIDRLALVATFVLAAALSLLVRHLVRKWVHRRRVDGRFNRRILLVGTRAGAERLIGHFAQAPYAGYLVVVVVLSEEEAASGDVVVGEQRHSVCAMPDDLLGAVEEYRADTIAVVDADVLGGRSMRRLGWQIEGTGIEMLVAPSVTDVAGPRISVTPVAGLPMLYVDEPAFVGVTAVTKAAYDRLLAVVFIVATAPVLFITGVAVALTSKGPVFYRQRRVGLLGREFTMVKFRTMVVDADERRGELEALDEGAGVLFKVRDDPRVTPVGRVLRRFSLDELPQLFNVVAGSMSLVGPRPQLPREVEQLADEGAEEGVHRRLLVKPGMTGLWQVSGRSDLTWEQSVRLDLSYVENWTPVLDAQIMIRTVGAVLRGRGAY
jgi:exopolysaccharide biosynthesis polyprenyl glycosylphosphotransferase